MGFIRIVVVGGKIIRVKFCFLFMVGEIILGGGGNEKQDHEVFEYFIGGLTKILYVPLAYPTGNNYEDCLSWFNGRVEEFDSQDKFVMVKELSSDINLNDFDGVYIGGGNTFKLLKEIKDSGFDKKLIEFYKNGGKIGGGSAGAIIFGKDIGTALICEDKDDNLVGLKDTIGMNVCGDWDIQAHYFDSQLDEHLDYLKRTGRNVIGIPDESAVVVFENSFKVIGTKEVTLISEDSTRKIKVGEEFKL
jgi:dipeptidase E